MNERINDILNRSRIREHWSPDENRYLVDFVDQEKFAELIVRECVSLGEEKSKELFSYSKKPGDIFEYQSHGAQDAVDAIKEHFGVE